MPDANKQTERRNRKSFERMLLIIYEWQDQELGINEVENLALISSTYFTFFIGICGKILLAYLMDHFKRRVQSIWAPLKNIVNLNRALWRNKIWLTGLRHSIRINYHFSQ